MGINDMKMMIRYSLGGVCITSDEVEKIDLSGKGKTGAQLMIPLNAGVVGRVEGLEDTLKIPEVTDFIQYYHVGDEVKPEFIGTLQQHFGRYTLIGETEEAIHAAISSIEEKLNIYDVDNKKMHVLRFDLTRVRA